MRTLIKGEKVILLNEPTVNLDLQTSTEIRKIISELKQKHKKVSYDEKLAKISKCKIDIFGLQKSQNNSK